MNPFARYLLAPAGAAFVIVAYEILRTLVLGPSGVDGAAQAFGFAAAVAGVLGAPLWIAGTLAVAIWLSVGAGAAWGRGDRPPLEPARRAAWVVFGALALAVVVVTTQRATMGFVAVFKKPVYQGLGAGLVAAGAVLAVAALAGPIVAVLARGLGGLGRRLPSALDPTRLPGAAIWVAVIGLVAAFAAPLLKKELHTIDLRGPRLGLAWVGLLAVGAWIGPRMVRQRVAVVVSAALGFAFCAAIGWSASALGRDQQRLVMLGRDTLLAGRAADAFRRLADRDGDGVPRLFGGADCNDDDPAIRPGVYDQPGDGVDQNCTGADLVLADDPLRARAHSKPVGERQRWNVVLITIDALRADAVEPLMPKLSAFSAQTIDFRQAYAHGAATYWTLASLITSKMPSRIEFGGDQTPVNRERVLAEVFRDGGWATALFANVTVFFVRGLRQGFRITNYDTSHFSVHGAKPGSAHLTDGVLEQLERWKRDGIGTSDKPFFIWAHYYDPHDPYFEVPDYPAEDDSDRARYDAIVRYTDAEVGRLVDEIRARGLWERTVVVITADHGDEFLDHGHRFHGSSVYEEMTHVPLLMHVPQLGAQRIEAPIGHIDVGPTLLDLMNFEIPSSFVGRSRATEARTGQTGTDEPVWLEVLPDGNYDGHIVGLRKGSLKLIHHVDRHVFELYDLATDPMERHNVYDEHPSAATLTRTLLEYVDHHLYAVGRGKTGARLPPGSPKKGAKSKPRVVAKPKPKPKPKPKQIPKQTPNHRPMPTKTGTSPTKGGFAPFPKARPALPGRVDSPLEAPP